jgi:hypothetical protein
MAEMKGTALETAPVPPDDAVPAEGAPLPPASRTGVVPTVKSRGPIEGWKPSTGRSVVLPPAPVPAERVR